MSLIRADIIDRTHRGQYRYSIATLLLCSTLLTALPALADKPATNALTTPTAIPTAAQQLHDIQEQHLLRTLTDRARSEIASEPDALYQVEQGGIALPPAVCQESADCQQELPQ